MARDYLIQGFQNSNLEGGSLKKALSFQPLVSRLEDSRQQSLPKALFATRIDLM